MPGIILILIAAGLFWADRRFGLSYLSAGFGASLGFVGIGLLFGFEIDQIEPFALLFATLIFTPIAVRLHFVREVRRIGMAEELSEADAVPPSDRNTEIILEHAPRVASLFQRFVFFFVQGTLLILIGTGLFGSNDLTGAHVAGIPAATSYQIGAIAGRYTASKVWQTVWASVGLFILGPPILFLVIAHRQEWRIGWLFGS